ncbi:MAG: DNA polymerase III subunit delta [Hydrogenothermus sp.]|nr:MAG: DNA polymerase III subunit delta [Hydrogenothermus sp.]
MSQHNLIQLIKKSKDEVDLKPVVFIYGAENLLKKQFIEKFKSKNKDFHFFWGDETGFKEIKEVFSSGALFSEGNEATIWDIDSFVSNLNKDEKVEFVEFLKKINSPDRIFLVSLKEKPQAKQPLKTILSISTVINSPKLTPKAFEISVYKKLKNSGKQINPEDLKYLVSKLPKDLYATKQEIEKLILYTEGKEIITKKDIDIVITVSPEVSVFAFVDLFFKKSKESIAILKKLFSQEIHPFEVQSLILTYANRLLLFKNFQKKKMPVSEIFAKLGLTYKPQQTTILNLAKSLSEEELIWLIKALYKLEYKQKVLYENIHTSLENLVLEFCVR